jgi:hypothetical protein
MSSAFFTTSKEKTMADAPILSLEKIRELLKDRRLYVVARGAGLSYPTVRSIALGERDAAYSTVKKLSDYFGKKN